MRGVLVAVAITVLTATGAAAGDARCNAPPYGGSVATFKAFIKNFGPLLDNPARTLAAICNAKFGGADRTGLYNLGFTDADINHTDTSDLAAEMILAAKNLVDRIH